VGAFLCKEVPVSRRVLSRDLRISTSAIESFKLAGYFATGRNARER